MFKTPKSLRLQLGLFGRTNVGKSTFLNYVASQDVAITSPVPGTTTDVVEKSMELLPIGPVVFLDTAGLDDVSCLAQERLKKTKNIFTRADMFVILTESNKWQGYEDEIVKEADKQNAPVIIIVNKIDLNSPKKDFLDKLSKISSRIVLSSSIDSQNRDHTINEFKRFVIELCPEDFINPPALIGDLLPKKDLAILIVPIDLEAPKGRIILPQVQAIRDILDNNQMSLVVKESEFKKSLDNLKVKPSLVVCDSQVVDRMVKETPKDIKCTTFSILFTRYKSDLLQEVKGVFTIDELKKTDKILIAEACSHHPIGDDIGRVKIPKWLRDYLGFDLGIDVTAGRDYPDDLSKYKLIIHCGACMITRREMLARIQKAREESIAVTNYGIAISYLNGVLERVLSPFPEALRIFQQEKAKQK